MRGKTVLAAALALSAAPLSAQEYVWTADRPDGVAPVSIAADRTLPSGTVEVGYRFARTEARGLKFGTEPYPELEALDVFSFVPLTRTGEAHLLTVGVGITDAVTVLASGGWVSKVREGADEETYFVNQSSGLSDIEVDGLWQVIASGPWRAHLQLGFTAPMGSVEERGDFPQSADVVLPYDMQIGTGSWAIVPGLGGQVMNERGSVGAQVRAVFSVTDNDRDYRPGSLVDARAWAAVRFNDFISASAGVRAIAAESIHGADPALESFRDPGDLALSFGGNRVDLPVGINVRFTEGPLAGQRIGAEAIWTVHEETDGPRLASDWGFVLGWQTAIGFF